MGTTWVRHKYCDTWVQNTLLKLCLCVLHFTHYKHLTLLENKATLIEVNEGPHTSDKCHSSIFLPSLLSCNSPHTAINLSVGESRSKSRLSLPAEKFDNLVASGEAGPDYAFERKILKRVYEMAQKKLKSW